MCQSSVAAETSGLGMLVDFVQFCVVLAKNVVLSRKLRIEWPRTIVTDALDVYGKL